MCLFTKQSRPFILKQNLIVYKVLNYNFKSPIQNFQYELNKLYSINHIEIEHGNYPALVKGCFENLDITIFKYKVNKAFHSYLDTNYAYDLHKRDVNFRIFKAIIPKYSEYVVGVYGDICSNKIIIDNVFI
jgi:hypothetical protein